MEKNKAQLNTQETFAKYVNEPMNDGLLEEIESNITGFFELLLSWSEDLNSNADTS